jgi:UDP-glucose 4-epimerase
MTCSIGIVGSNGFIGRAVGKYFASLGFDLHMIDREIFKSIISEPQYNEIDYFDYVIWLASSVNPQTAEQREDLIRRDLQELRDFIERLSGSPGKTTTTIIFISSGGCVYSGNETPFTEESIARGSNNYGTYKLAAENLVEDSKIPFAIVRASNIYGPNQPVGRGQGVIAEWIESAKNSTPLKVFGSLDNSRDFLFIDDFNDALGSIIRNNFTGTINVGSGEPTSLRSVLECIKSESKAEVTLENYPNRGIDRQEYFLDISKAKLRLHWEPKIPLALGINAAFNFNQSLH